MTSEIRTNSLTSRAGLSTVTLTDSGPMFSGITTFVDNSTFSVGTGGTIHAPATNTLNIGVNNTESLRIDSNSNLKVAGIVTATHFYGNGSNLSGIPAQASISNNADNRVITGGSGVNLNGEANLSFNGTNVKIGSGTPAIAVGSGLEIDSGGAATVRLEDSGSTSSFEIQNTGGVIKQNMYNNQPWTVAYNSSEKLRIDSSGRVMIGTTNEGEANADDLTIATTGHTGITLRSGTSNYGQIFFSDAGSGTGEYEGIIAYDHSNNSMVFHTTRAERLRIYSGGQVSIRNTNATSFNSGGDDLVIGNGTDGQDAGITLYSHSSDNGSIFFNDTAGTGVTGLIQYRHSEDAMRFMTATQERLRIDSDGRLLHGNTSNSGVAGHGIRVQSDAIGSNYSQGAVSLYGTGGDFYAITMRNSANHGWGILPIFSASTDYLAFGYYNATTSSNSGALFQIFETGNVVAAGSVDSASDIKLKTNVKTIDNALDKVLKLRGAEYDRIDKDNKHEIGVIAQEVEKIIPELVNTNEDPDGEKTKTVSYGNMVAVLIEAIKEQNEVISEMKKEIDELKSS